MKTFQNFLVEMNENPEKINLRTIITSLINGDKDWLNRQEISYGDKGDYWILNYAPTGGRNDYNRLVRGLVVQKPDEGFNDDPLKLIRSFPFTRFYNQGEKEADYVDFNNAEMLEKMDGTMVGVFFPKGNPNQPLWHTRKMVSTHEPDLNLIISSFHNKNYKLMPLIGQYVKKLNFNEEDVEYTYVFEFIHDATQVLTKYKEKDYGLYLIGARNIFTHNELDENRLDHLAARLGCRRPRRWDSIASQDEINKMFAIIAEKTEDFEGFVFRDRKTGKRVKVKDPKYVEKHHLLGDLSYKKLIPRIFEGEEEEIIAYLPQAKEKIDLIKDKMREYIEYAAKRVMYWQESGLKGKELSQKLFGKRLLSKWEERLLKMQDQKVPNVKPAEKDDLVKNIVLQNQKKNLNLKEIKELIFNKLRDVALGEEHQRVALAKEIEKKKQENPDVWIRNDINPGNPGKVMEILGISENDDN